MTIIEKLEKAALDFMAKRLPLENNVKKDIYNLFMKAKREIEIYLKSLPDVNLSNLSNIIQNEIRFILNKYFTEINIIIENVIENNMESGIEQGNRFITITKESTDPILYNENKSEYLAALLLFSKQLIQNFNDELLSKLDKDLYTAYILSRDDTNGGLLTRNLSGEVLSDYTNRTFDQFQKRADTISQTESNKAINTGSMLTLISFKRDLKDLKVKWVEVKDQKLCKHCRERANGGPLGDGVYDFGSITPPPLHPNCRCILIPYLSEWH